MKQIQVELDKLFLKSPKKPREKIAELDARIA
jgi:hypothetical protein